MEEKFTRPMLRYAGHCWNQSRLAAFSEARQSIRAYFYGAKKVEDLETMADLCAGLDKLEVEGCYDLESGAMTNQELPYRKNWYEE